MLTKQYLNYYLGIKNNNNNLLEMFVFLKKCVIKTIITQRPHLLVPFIKISSIEINI